MNANYSTERDGWAKDEIRTQDSGEEKGAWGTAKSSVISQGMFGSMKEQSLFVFLPLESYKVCLFPK